MIHAQVCTLCSVWGAHVQRICLTFTCTTGFMFSFSLWFYYVHTTTRAVSELCQTCNFLSWFFPVLGFLPLPGFVVLLRAYHNTRDSVDLNPFLNPIPALSVLFPITGSGGYVWISFFVSVVSQTNITHSCAGLHLHQGDVVDSQPPKIRGLSCP